MVCVFGPVSYTHLVTAVVYAPAFGFVYNNMDEMVRAYCKAPNSVCIEQGVDWREGICRDNKVDGVLVHYNRSCKPWSGYMAEMQRRFTKDLGVPCAGFDGDQADPRNFNEAQYETRVQGLVEAMEANKAAKEAAEKLSLIHIFFEGPSPEIIKVIREEIDPGQAFIKVPKE